MMNLRKGRNAPKIGQKWREIRAIGFHRGEQKPAAQGSDPRKENDRRKKKESFQENLKRSGGSGYSELREGRDPFKGKLQKKRHFAGEGGPICLIEWSTV